MPVPLITEAGNGPRISSIEPASGPIGSLLTIHGSDFGSSRNNSGVVFSWAAEAAPGIIESPGFIEISEAEFGYELWADREIRVRVPDGAISGNLEVRTPGGNSRPVFFDITGRPGTKIYLDRKTYTFSYMADIQIERAVSPNSLFLWMPVPAVSASQRNVRLLSRNIEPFIENYRGTSLYQFINASARDRWEISISYEVEVYAVETNIRNQAAVRLNRPSPVGAAYVLPSPHVPSNDPAIIAQATTIIAREALPFARAQRIYNWLISSIEIQNTFLSEGVLEALEEQIADSYQAALLFCALARAVNIPAIPVAGVLVNSQNEAIRHYWAEFWLDGFGWVPLDPALGAGAAPEGFVLRDDHARYYFGNMDNQRITFSRGERFLYQMTPRGRTTYRNRGYSLQNLWEEATGGLESYYSLWSDVIITGVFSQ
jgi:transglutaminase-like putative cysteine protease